MLKTMTEETQMPVSPVSIFISTAPLTDSLQVWMSWVESTIRKLFPFGLNFSLWASSSSGISWISRLAFDQYLCIDVRRDGEELFTDIIQKDQTLSHQKFVIVSIVPPLSEGKKQLPVAGRVIQQAEHFWPLWKTPRDRQKFRITMKAACVTLREPGLRAKQTVAFLFSCF